MCFTRTLAILLLAALIACTRSSEWQPLPIAEGGFSVLMRPNPQYQRQEAETPAGRMTAHLYSSDRPDSYFAVGYSDYPLAQVVGAEPEGIFAGIRETWLKRINGRLLVRSPLELEGKYAGHEFIAEGTVKAHEVVLHARIYLADQRLYQVIAMTRKGEVPQGVVNRFLHSFKLIPTAEIGTIQIKPPVK